VTNRKETYFPEFKRLNLRIFSFLSVFVITLLSSALIGVVFYLEYLVLYYHTKFQFRFFDWAVAALISVLIEVFSYLYMGFSTVLADNENHRTETEYEDSLITKTVFFKIFNHYGAVIFTIFFKGFLGE
jgi:anoctamin-10